MYLTIGVCLDNNEIDRKVRTEMLIHSIYVIITPGSNSDVFFEKKIEIRN